RPKYKPCFIRPSRPNVFAAPRRSRVRRDRPFTVRLRALKGVKSAIAPVPATPAYGIVSAFLCRPKNVPFTPVFVHFWFTYHASTGETHGCIRRCTEDAQRQRGQVRRPSFH